MIRVSLKGSKFRASGRVKFIALGPPAPSWGRPEAVDALERAAGAETALTLVNCTNPMLFQCPAAEHGGIPPSFKSRGDAQARGLPRGAARICAGSMSTRPEVGRRRPELEDSLGQFVRAFLRKKVTAVWTNRAALPLPVADRDHLLITLSLGCRDSGRVVFCDPERQSGVDHGKTQEAISKGPKEKRGESTP